MFDIGFWELTLIAIMGLVILGPERLPVAIRTLRSWITGVRKFSDTVKSEVTEELRIHELHTNLKKAEQGDLKNLSPEVAESLKSLKEAANLVTEPFKKVDTTPLESMISSSLASAPKPDVTESSIESSNTDTSMNTVIAKEQSSDVVSSTNDPTNNNSTSIESDKLQS
jgi:sec-independent protein translocase protein TatB